MVRRVWILGLDGAAPELVRRWQEDLPNLRRLMEEGAWGVLRSTLPPYTLPAWPSMATGVGPGKLGIFGFRRRRPGTYRFEFATFADAAVPTLWEILAAEGRRTGVVGLPGTFPPQPIEGFMVSGFPAPANDGRLTYTHPPQLSRQIEARFGTYEFEVYTPYAPGQEAAFFEACRRTARLHADVALWLADREPWDLLFVVFATIDRASHYFWHFQDPEHPAYDPEAARRWGSVLREIYRLEDAHLGRLLERVGEEDLVLVVSDHGFGPRTRTFFVNEWLRQKGYLALKAPPGSGGRAWGGWIGPLIRLYQRHRWLRTLWRPFRRTRLRRTLLQAHHARRFGHVRFEEAPVDWARTVAYALDQHRIYLNLKGREPQGTVPPERYEEILAQLEADLRSLTDEAGRPVPVQLIRGRDAFPGPFREEAPDLLLFLDGHRCDLSIGLGREELFGPAGLQTGTHRPEGIVILWGPGVRRGARIEGEIPDVLPTVLHALDLPIPEHCDGRVWLEAFEEASEVRRRPPRRRAFDRGRRVGYDWSAEEEAELRERLEDLGYL